MGYDETLRQTYDELPYETRARRKAHPDTLATIARLFGLSPPAVDTARVLEIGCGTGENLLAIACALPDASCIGVDFSALQIAQADSLAEAARIDNAEFLTGDFTRVDRGDQAFDYVIAHGLLSWIPPDRHDDLLAACARYLAPGGLLYLSCNALPDWHKRRAVRDYMLRACAVETSPAARVAAGRQALAALAETLAGSEGSYSSAIRKELANVEKLGDSYVAHDLLETFNTPFYFDDVVARYTARDLHYVGEAGFEAMITDTYPAADADALRSIDDLREREQKLDFLINRTFRESVFSRGELPDAMPSQRPIAAMFVSAGLQRVSEGDDGAIYRDMAGREVALMPGPVQAALDALANQFPRALAVEDLVSTVYETDIHLRGVVALVNAIFVAFSRGYADLHTTAPALTNVPGATPQASRLARAQAQRGTRGTSLLLENVELDDAGCRAILPALDGRHHVQSLAAHLSPNTDEYATARVSTALAKLAHAGLIER